MAAVESVYEQLGAHLDKYLPPTKLFASMPGFFASVWGRKEGRPARAATWTPQAYYTERNWLHMTAARAAVSVVRLRGDIRTAGAFGNVADVDSLNDARIAEIQSLMPEAPAGVPFVDRRIEFLEEAT